MPLRTSGAGSELSGSGRCLVRAGSEKSTPNRHRRGGSYVVTFAFIRNFAFAFAN